MRMHLLQWIERSGIPATPRHHPWTGGLVGVLLVLLISSCGTGTQTRTPTHPAPNTPPAPRVQRQATPPSQEPVVRIRLTRSQNRLVITGSGQAQVQRLTASTSAPLVLRLPLVIEPLSPSNTPAGVEQEPGAGPGAGVLIHSQNETRGYTWQATALRIICDQGSTLGLAGVPYPGAMVVHLRPEGLEVINHLPLEQYLPGVLDREFYKSWHPEAFKAQAIAARSYAIAQQAENPRRDYDLESTTASQAYGGQTTNRKALDAVAATRGQVLMFQGHVLCAFYSSSCGGIGQDAAIAFPGEPNLPPLQGHPHDACCADSPNYRWHLVRNRVDLENRLRAWGNAQDHPIAQMGELATLTLSANNRAGRPAQFVVTDTAGRRYVLRCESLRVAANHPAPPLPAATGDALLRSSFLTATVRGPTVTFDGAGFGHGVGLCQWGAQHLATTGMDAPAILRFYYPGASPQKTY